MERKRSKSTTAYHLRIVDSSQPTNRPMHLPSRHIVSAKRNSAMAAIAVLAVALPSCNGEPARTSTTSSMLARKLRTKPSEQPAAPKSEPNTSTLHQSRDEPFVDAADRPAPGLDLQGAPTQKKPDLAERPPAVDENRVAAHGIRKLSAGHLTLYTDLPADEEIDRLPAIFDQAFPQWCEYFDRPDLADRAWQVRGCLINDAAKFKAAGLLPDDLPPFKFGYARGSELWLHEQPTAYYRRHLLLHEATHAFMQMAFGTCGPPWYMEGIAELLGNHSLVDGRLTLGVFPARADDVPEWGRIRMVREAVAEGRSLGVDDILAYPDDAHLHNEPYGWCWALAAFLDGHPRYRDRFRQLPGELSAEDFNTRVRAIFAADWRELNEEWQVFVHDLDFGYDLARAAIEFETGEPLNGRETVALRADRGWQSSGVRLEAGKTYRLTASGRYQVADQPRPWWCEPGGVTIRYVRGRPLGMLLAGLLPDVPASEAVDGLLSPVAVGLETTITPQSAGTLYLRINDSPAELSNNSGTLQVIIEAQTE